MIKKLLAVGVFVAGMGAGAIGMAATQQTFDDVTPNMRAYEAIEAMAAQGIINGYPDGTFKPNQAVTRAEAAIMMHRLQQAIEAEEDGGGDGDTASLSSVKNYKYYLDEGNADILAKMKAQDLVIVEPVVMDTQYTKAAQDSGTIVYGYINSMEADNWNTELMKQFREEAFFHNPDGSRYYIERWDAYLMDISNRHYQDVLLAEIGRQIVDKGLDGVFLDTVGSIEDYHSDNPAVMAQQQAGMKTFMQRIKQTYPGLSIAQNWGFDTLENYTAPYVDFVMWEQFDARLINGDEWYTENIERLKQIRAEHGVEVFTVSFQDEQASRQIAESHGFKNVYNPAGSYYNEW